MTSPKSFIFSRFNIACVILLIFFAEYMPDTNFWKRFFTCSLVKGSLGDPIGYLLSPEYTFPSFIWIFKPSIWLKGVVHSLDNSAGTVFFTLATACWYMGLSSAS